MREVRTDARVTLTVVVPHGVDFICRGYQTNHPSGQIGNVYDIVCKSDIDWKDADKKLDGVVDAIAWSRAHG